MAGAEDGNALKSWLICRVGGILLALPLDHVVEVMRVLSIEPLARTLPFVCGVSVLRGHPVPVVDAGLLLGAREAQAERIVSLRAADRPFALLVGSVIGVRRFAAGELSDPPPLLRQIAAEVVSAIALLDEQFVVFLGTALVVPPSVLEASMSDQIDA